MFDERKAEKITNTLDKVFDALMAMGIPKEQMREFLNLQDNLSQTFEAMANNRDPFED